MGITTCNYVVDDWVIDKVTNEDFDLNKYLSDLLMEHEYKGHHFEIEGVSFWQGVKSWCPMYELIKILDKSDIRILQNINSDELIYEESKFNDWICVYNSSLVKNIWMELKKISIFDIEKSIDNPEIVQSITSIPGYRNRNIKHKINIVMEFVTFYQAFFHAQLRNKGIITTFG